MLKWTLGLENNAFKLWVDFCDEMGRKESSAQFLSEFGWIKKHSCICLDIFAYTIDINPNYGI